MDHQLLAAVQGIAEKGLARKEARVLFRLKDFPSYFSFDSFWPSMVAL